MRCIGFVGFGEAGSTLAAGLRAAGVDRILAFDIATESADRGPLIRQRAADTATTLVDSPAGLSPADLIFSTVTSSSALEAAREMAPFLGAGQIYADLNSVSPALKREVAGVIAAIGATFVEAAVMAPVKPYGHRVPMLVDGPGAAAFAEIVQPLGMKLELLPGDVGTAAAVKMCRSIVVKGLEAILFECVLAATRYDADARVFASLQESYPGIDWTALADYAVNRVVVHGERRAREMEEVAETLRAIGVEPMMAEATAKRQQWASTMKLRERFAAEGPSHYREVIEALEKDSPSSMPESPGDPRIPSRPS